jgi:hypothetical protein
MKGGITSGVVYPNLIYELAQRYRFKNIGGASAGAIAAGACAAAEYGRREGKGAGFIGLKSLPQSLGDRVQPNNRSRLLSLFQPDPAVQAHFSVLLRSLNQDARTAIADMLSRILVNHVVLAAAALIGGAALLSPLVISLAPALSGGSAFGLSLAALIVVGLSARWAVVSANGWQFPLTLLVVYLLIILGLKACPGVSWSWTLAGVALSMLVGTLLVLTLLLGLVTWRFVVTLLHGLHRNGYGLCSGRTMAARPGANEPTPGLTDWLTDYFDELAGIPNQGDPLTFRDLWGGDDRRVSKAVNLEVMTSAVSQQMIYSIPFRDGVPTLYYEIGELERLFPPRVVNWIESCAAAAEKACKNGLRPDQYTVGTRIRNLDGKILRPFPRGADLPVVVAVRMSLSFPVLLSAVPLYSVDFTRVKNQEEAKRMRETRADGKESQATFEATRIWFSDGGIGSNMPLHMFDALLPGHPTFAINLKAEHPDTPIVQPETGKNEDGRIFLPEDNRSGALRYWAAPNDDQPLGGLLGFLSSIVNTMQNWRDEIQFPYPGFKDRIVQISQQPTEGGLNLDMPSLSIEALSNAGGLAANRLIDRFHPGGVEKGKGWTNHQTIRLKTFLGTMQPGSAALFPTINTGHWAALAGTMDGYTTAEHQIALEFLAGLGNLGSLGQQGTEKVSLARCAPKPLAQIRIGPKI